MDILVISYEHISVEHSERLWFRFCVSGRFLSTIFGHLGEGARYWVTCRWWWAAGRGESSSEWWWGLVFFTFTSDGCERCKCIQTNMHWIQPFFSVKSVVCEAALHLIIIYLKKNISTLLLWDASMSLSLDFVLKWLNMINVPFP